MRGSDQRSGSLFSYVDLDSRVRADHPLRSIRTVVNDVLLALSAEFEALYAAGLGRPSIPPERLLRALLLQAFYGLRSERQIMERLEFDLLFRWFVGLGIDDAAWDPTTFGKNRDRLLAGDVAHKVLAAVLAHPKVKRLLSSEHFSVDGTMVEAWASMKSFRPKDGSGEPPAPGRNGEGDFHGQRRSNATHASTTDPDARLYRKGAGREAKLCFLGHALMENRNGLVVDACLTRADGHAERVAALHMIEPRADRPTRITLGADKGYDAEDFVNELRTLNVTPHVAAKAKAKGSALEGRTTGRAGYRISQVIRKRIEDPRRRLPWRARPVNEQALVSKVWNYAHVLRDDGVSFGDYLGQISFLLFLKMDKERTDVLGEPSMLPEDCQWDALAARAGEDLERRYRAILEKLSRQEGIVGTLFLKAESKIGDPAKLQRLVGLIGAETWMGLNVDVKGTIYEGLLERNAGEVKSGAGQYFTPRPLIDAITESPTRKELSGFSHL